MTIAPMPDMRMATALRPPACDSPRLPVCGDLNIATVLDPRGKSPSRGPVASTTGASGASGSMPAGQFSVRSWIATPAPPKYFPNRSSRRSTQERFLLRSTYRTLASGSFGSIGDLLATFFERQHSMRAVLGTVATMHADDRLLSFLSQKMALTMHASRHSPQPVHFEGFRRTPPPLRRTNASSGHTLAHGGSWHARQTTTERPRSMPPTDLTWIAVLPIPA